MAFPPKAPLQHIWSFHHPAQLLLELESESGLWQDELQQTPDPAGTGRAAPGTDTITSSTKCAHLH